MSYKRTYAFTRGTWDGTPGSSNFTQDPTVFATTEEFIAGYTPDADLAALILEYETSGDILVRSRELSVDGKVKINTTEFFDQAAHDACAADIRWNVESELSRAFDVEEAPVPEDVNTFNGDIYYHSSAHLF